MDRNKLKASLILHEGLKLKIYKDPKDIWTAGVGRNMEDVGLRVDEALYMLDNDIDECARQLDSHIPWWMQLNDIRQNALIDMCFMGISRLMGFTKMLAALQAGNWDEAAKEVLDSKWAADVGPVRSAQIADAIRTGL